jgi:hypothetical protein
MTFNHLTGNKALSACPSCWSVVEDVLNGVIVSLARDFVGDKSKYTYVDLESTVRAGLQVVQFLAQDWQRVIVNTSEEEHMSNVATHGYHPR